MDDVRAATEASRIAHGRRDFLKKATRDYRIGVDKGQNIAMRSACSGVSNPRNIMNGLVHDCCAE
jgi:hypothetical protein